MSFDASLPDGFVRVAHGPATLIADGRRLEALARAGLDAAEGWRRAAGSARGETARVELAPDCVARVKQLRRGGWTAWLWRDAFAGSRRVRDNLRLPVEVARRQVATPAPIAMWVEPCCPGFVRAWLAVEEVAGAIDLRRWLGSDPPAVERGLAIAMAVLREMHNRGVEHRDLNLGNVLLQGEPPAAAFVVDLDRARLHGQPLRFEARQRALRRIERSYVKLRYPKPASETVRDAFYNTYAGKDPVLAVRLERGRKLGRVAIALHRLGWRAK